MTSRVMQFALSLLSVALLSVFFSGSQAGVIHVDQAGGGDYEIIQDGINAATYGDTVLVAPGTYYEHLYMGPAADGVTLRGEFGPEQTTVHNESTYPYSVLFCEDVGADTRVEGLTFDGGYSDAHGGGIRCDRAHVRIENVSVTSCSALESHGGGIAGQGSDLVVLSSMIGNNRSGIGGGISIDGGSLYAEGNLVAGNSADWISLDRIGGGIYISCDGADIIDNQIESNNALDGGGIAVDRSSNISITGNRIINNSATDRAGGIYIFESDCVVSGNAITGNYAITTGGGAVDIDLSETPSRLDPPVFTGNTFFGNIAYGCEAAIRVHDGGQPPEFNGNYFADATTYEVLVVTSPERLTIDFTGNWWDTEDPLEIAGKIYDCDDNGGLAWCVDYSDWCDEASCGGQATSVEETPGTTPVSWGQLKSLYR